MKKVEKIDAFFEFLRVFLGIVIAFLVCIIIILLISEEDPGSAIYNFVVGPFMTPRRFGQVLAKYASYLLASLGMCFIYAAGRFNMAGEGTINLAPMPILIVMFGTTFGTSIMTGLPQIVNLILIIASCAVTGALILLVPAFGRERLGANEMVTSTIMNYFCMYAALWILKGTVADRSLAALSTANYPENMRFTRYWNGSNFTSGIYVAIIGLIIALVIFYRTPLGAKIRMCGDNLQFAIYSGINAKKMMYIAQIIGGLFAGAAAAVEIFGLYDAYYLQLLTNVGMDGLLAAVMAKKKPIFVPLTAFIMAYIRCAAAVLNANTNIPVELVTMLQAVIVLFVAAEEFLGRTRRKVIYKIASTQQMEESKEVSA
ncbi:ABC transporter permease [Parablautia sp. Marseille-Q6255]|uniref:ABC transporter permease n=1 Tax=Parablautia sp. Marseille-Q6255 TaxID=3039593 RepID=UPI0024BC4AE5|nr:ABC transporter permease [Parablautia sp. Marseille-Q6255]